VIILDANVVVALQREDHVHYRVARSWLDRLLDDGQSFGVPAMIWSSFVRLTTDPRIFGSSPTPVLEAFLFVHDVLVQPGYQPVEPGPLHLGIAETMCRGADARGKLVPDAFLAAVAIENAATVASFDRDFARFDGLDWIIPAAP